ncbi:MAG: hypothetical protein WBA45_07415 [Microthrixaceae bacterium]
MASAVIALVADAIALLVAMMLVEDMNLTSSGFVLAVVIFGAVSLLIEPLMRQIAIKNLPALLGSSTLVATLVSLIVTAIISNSLTIRGLGAWVFVTVLVWAVGLVARMVLPLVIFKKILAANRQS